MEKAEKAFEAKNQKNRTTENELRKGFKELDANEAFHSLFKDCSGGREEANDGNRGLLLRQLARPQIAELSREQQLAFSRRGYRVGDVVASFSVRDDHGKAVDTDCRLYTGDQLEIILAADDGSKTRVLHVDKAGSQAERNSIRARGLWGNVAKTVRAAAVVKSKK